MVTNTAKPGSLLERHMGANHNATREQRFNQAAAQCPPVDPNLLRHLEMMFSDITSTKPDHPQLSQMLLVQHGVNKLVGYLQRQYDAQSEAARKARSV